MKKLYFLNEEEKNRILNIHENATKRQYLNEWDPGLLGYNLVKYGGPVIASLSSEKLPDLEYKLWGTSKDRVSKLGKKCGDTPFNPNSEIYKQLSKWFIYGGYGTIGREWAKLPGILSNIKNVSEYCEVSNSLKTGGPIPNSKQKYESLISKSLGESLRDEIGIPSNWIKYFEKPMQKVLADAGLDNLEGVTKISTDTVPDNKTTNNTQTTTTNQYTGSGGSGSGWISINSKYDKEILNALGKKGEKLTDNDIKDIYDKLKSAGKIT